MARFFLTSRQGHGVHPPFGRCGPGSAHPRQCMQRMPGQRGQRMQDKWVIYLVVAVLGFVLGIYLIVGIVSWIFKALLILFFILFVYVVFKVWRRSRARDAAHR
jgi:uncharacterized membrane protein YphA (DoxX/SURF4 family)